MDRKTKYKSILLIITLIIVLFIFYTSGYSLNENQVLRNSYSNVDGEAVYNKKFDNNKVVIWKTEKENFVKLVETKLGFIYRVTNEASLQFMYPMIGEYGDLKRTWSASLNSKSMYDTIIAVESLNPEITKVIVSNDNIDNVILNDIDEIKENSTLFIELILEDGFAASYNELSTKDAGGFIFRGISNDGKMLIIGR